MAELLKPSITYGWVVYRQGASGIEILGIMQTEEKAKKDVEIMAERGMKFEIKQAPFVGWGEAAPGVFSQNGPPPLKIVQ